MRQCRWRDDRGEPEGLMVHIVTITLFAADTYRGGKRPCAFEREWALSVGKQLKAQRDCRANSAVHKAVEHSLQG
jgi:hypothetical protein